MVGSVLAVDKIRKIESIVGNYTVHIFSCRSFADID